MLQVASEQCPSIKVLYLPSSELRLKSNVLESRWNNTLPINGIQKMHIFKPDALSGTLAIGRFASEYPHLKVRVCREVLSMANELQPSPRLPEPQPSPPSPEPQQSPPPTLFSVGEWILVKYDDALYPGEVREVGDQEVKVFAMMKSGNYYKWPKSEDCIFYPIKNVVMKLQPPTFKSARGTFEFTEKW